MYPSYLVLDTGLIDAQETYLSCQNASLGEEGDRVPARSTSPESPQRLPAVVSEYITMNETRSMNLNANLFPLERSLNCWAAGADFSENRSIIGRLHLCDLLAHQMLTEEVDNPCNC